MAIEPWLQLLSAASPGSRRWRELLLEHGSAEAIVALSRSVLESADLPPQSIARLAEPDTTSITRWRSWLDEPERHLVVLGDRAYPQRLAEIADAPIALWIEGSDLDLLASPQLAIVGSRNPTRGGRDTARRFARYFSARGLAITSGLATGIDAAGHAGALEGIAGTVAVLGSGLEKLYPRSNAELAGRIKRGGLLVSEYPPGTEPRPHHFPQRNRIIAALSLGTLVVEAARNSGALITARLAGEYGREVFAIPGSIHNPLAKGCHTLIREGAKLVDDAADILLELAPQLTIATPLPPTPSELTEDEPSLTKEHAYRLLLDVLGFEPTGIAVLAERTGLTTAEVSSMLLLLELDGLVEALPGGRYARLSQRD